MKLISIVVPCYNEEEALPFYYKAVTPILKQLEPDYEIIFVDDGSKDQTATIIKDLAKQDSHFKYCIFSRNFGKESAMYAGLEKSKGDYVAIMDADLQDPPERLIEMYHGIVVEGYDCVGIRRISREGEPKIRSFFARQFYKLINKMSETEIVDGARDYRLMTRKMVDAILSVSEYNRFSKGIFSWVGFKTKWLEYKNIQRVAGETKWSFKKLLRYSIDGIISFSTAPLKLISKLGVTFIALSIIFAIFCLIVGFLPNPMIFDSWVYFLTVLVFLFGIGLVCLGIVGLYLSKTYAEVKNRPIYVEKESNISKRIQ